MHRSRTQGVPCSTAQQVASTSVTVSGREMRIRDRDGKQPKTSLSNSISVLFSPARLFIPRVSTASRVCTTDLFLAMATKTPESTPEAVAQSKKRRERKKLGHEVQRNDPPPRPNNSSFLARPWIELPEANETLIQHRVRVMTWNV